MSNINKIIDPNKGHVLHKKAEHVGAALALSAAGRAAARQTDPRIDVMVMKSQEGGPAYAPVGEMYLFVKMYSHVKPDFLVQAPLQFRGKSERDIDFEIGVLCGAMAERLDEAYGDNFDPDKAAREGSRKLKELLQAWEDKR